VVRDGEDGGEELSVHGHHLLLHLDWQLEVRGDVVLLHTGEQCHKVQLASRDVLPLPDWVLRVVQGPHVRPPGAVLLLQAPLLSVSLPVLLEVLTARKCLVTDSAGELSLSSVSSFVSRQLGLSSKPPAAAIKVAGKGTFTSVEYHVGL